MRIYTDPYEAVRETERVLYEMGIDIHPQTMQDKDVRDDPNYLTKEIRGYGFKITDWDWDEATIKQMLACYYDKEEARRVLAYICTEFQDRVAGRPLNPGNSYLTRTDVWDEFLHDDQFAYTYSERMTPQLNIILEELKANTESRQAIINIHSNICPMGHNMVIDSTDLANRGAGGRVPCSMYYQIMVRESKVDLIYTMRSCDFLTHFPVDISIALLLQSWFAHKLKLAIGTFTYFAGSMHAYKKDLGKRGIF